MEFSLLGKVRKTRHRFAVNGRKIFHREAGGDTSPALLHGRRPTCSATSSRLCQATTMWWPRLTGLRVLRGTGPGAFKFRSARRRHRPIHYRGSTRPLRDLRLDYCAPVGFRLATVIQSESLRSRRMATP